MRLSPSDLRALTVFRALGEGQGFLGAQITLGMSQSTISFHLKALEERVGFQLCHRGRRGFQLTERGRDFRPVLLAMLDFGNKHFPPDDREVRIVNTETGERVEPLLVDPATGKRVDRAPYRVVSTLRQEQAA